MKDRHKPFWKKKAKNSLNTAISVYYREKLIDKINDLNHEDVVFNDIDNGDFKLILTRLNNCLLSLLRESISQTEMISLLDVVNNKTTADCLNNVDTIKECIRNHFINQTYESFFLNVCYQTLYDINDSVFYKTILRLRLSNFILKTMIDVIFEFSDVDLLLVEQYISELE